MINSIWPKRLVALDISRGIAALAVVVWHWQQLAYNGTSLSKDFVRAHQPLYALLKIFYEKGELGVQYFFVLSGFIFFWLYRTSIADRNVNFSIFWIQRISRLYPLHILTLLIVALLQAIYFSHTESSFVYPFNDKYHFFLNLAFASKWGFEKGWSFNAPVWSVSIEILLYFIFFMIAYARQGRILLCLSISITCTVIKQLFPLSSTYYLISQAMTLFFLGGVVFHVALAMSTKLRKLKPAIYITTLLFWALTIINYYIFDFSSFILKLNGGNLILTEFPIWLLFPFTVCSLALFETEIRAGILSRISWIGDISYSSYLLHFPLQLVFGIAVSYGLLNSDFYLNPIYLVVFFSMLVPLSYVTFIRFERPIQNAIRNKYMWYKNTKA